MQYRICIHITLYIYFCHESFDELDDFLCSTAWVNCMINLKGSSKQMSQYEESLEVLELFFLLMELLKKGHRYE